MVNNISKDFVYVTDVADAAFASIIKNKNKIYNIGSGNGVQIKEIAEKIVSMTDSKSLIKIIQKQDNFDSIIDIKKAQNSLKFSPKISLDEGLENEIDWHVNYNK